MHHLVTTVHTLTFVGGIFHNGVFRLNKKAFRLKGHILFKRDIFYLVAISYNRFVAHIMRQTLCDLLWLLFFIGANVTT